MGIRCPVCDRHHPDRQHLADHMAITAVLRSGRHRHWLIDRVPDWSELGRHELGIALGEIVEPEPDEETDQHRSVEVPRQDERVDRHAPPRNSNGVDAAIVAEAKRLTQEMLEPDDEDIDCEPE